MAGRTSATQFATWRWKPRSHCQSPGFIQKTVGGHCDRHAGLIAFLETVFALPTVAGIVQVSVGRHLHSHAPIHLHAVAAFAFPPSTIVGVDCEGMRRCQNAFAIAAGLPETAIASPARSERGVVCMRVGRDVDCEQLRAASIIPGCSPNPRPRNPGTRAAALPPGRTSHPCVGIPTSNPSRFHRHLRARSPG